MSRKTSRLIELVHLMAETFDLKRLLASIEQAAVVTLDCDQAQTSTIASID